MVKVVGSKESLFGLIQRKTFMITNYFGTNIKWCMDNISSLMHFIYNLFTPFFFNIEFIYIYNSFTHSFLTLSLIYL